MKEFMKKKVLGIPMTLVVLGILVLGGATAQLVGFLSNAVNAEVNVTSPIVYEISETEAGGYAEVVAIDAIGGDTVEFYIRATNNANNPIEGQQSIIVKNVDGVTCEDFESINVSTETSPGTFGGEVDVLDGNCVAVNNKNIEIVFDTLPMDPGVEKSKVRATFKPAAMGLYNATIQMIPASSP